MPELTGLQELGQQELRLSPTRLSHEEQDRLILRGFHGRYRWYVDQFQCRRNWIRRERYQ